MIELEKDITTELRRNSILFLKDGIERLLSKDNGDEYFLSHNLIILTCTSFQISLELALKALAVEKSGIRSILATKQEKLSDEGIKELYLSNQIKTREFERLKNFIKSKNFIDELDQNDFDIINDFQSYRNRIVHFSFRFQEGDLYDFKYDLIYFLIHIIFKILLSDKRHDERPSEFVFSALGEAVYKNLIRYKPYIQAMERLAVQNSSKVYGCVDCTNRTYSLDDQYCYCCNFSGEQFEFIKCDYCGEQRSFIYDNLNIELNHNMIKGLCLNCWNDGIVFQCPKCGTAYNIETDISDNCTNEKCINDKNKPNKH